MQTEAIDPIWARKQVLRAAAVAALLVFTGWLIYTPEGLLGKADAVGYAVCHRIDVRSFQLGDRPISFCTRCTGMYLGAFFGLVMLQLRAPRRGGNPPRRVLIGLAAVTAVFATDSINSFTNLIPGFPSLYTTTNTIRVFAGTGFGLVMAVFVYPAFNQTVWARWDPRPAVGSLQEFALLLAGGALIAGLVWLQNPLILYPASLVSAAGVVLLLTLVYAMLTMLVFKRENFAAGFRDLAGPLLIGFTIAMLQIAGADLVRFYLTGTWEGFHIGMNPSNFFALLT